MSDRVTVHVADGIADVRLSRADKMNALDPPMFEALIAASERLGEERGLRAVVLSGEGRGFCAGLDLNSFAAMKEGGIRNLEARTHGISNRFQYAVMCWRELGVPVVAAVHGVAFGGGFQLALGADLRLVAHDTRMSIMEIKWGIVPDMGGTILMRHLAREDVIRELTYSGRIFSAEEARAYGFATRVCPDPHTEALVLARDIAEKNPDAIRAAKRLFNIAAAGSDAAACLLAESREQARLIGSPNQTEAVMANLEKRTPRFSD
ncbi:MAG: crotonase/enoyl-CoA hydratase family protein [Xanthobacteraceae bacterium]